MKSDYDTSGKEVWALVILLFRPRGDWAGSENSTRFWCYGNCSPLLAPRRKTVQPRIFSRVLLNGFYLYLEVKGILISFAFPILLQMFCFQINVFPMALFRRSIK